LIMIASIDNPILSQRAIGPNVAMAVLKSHTIVQAAKFFSVDFMLCK